MSSDPGLTWEEILTAGLHTPFIRCSGCETLVLTSTSTPWTPLSAHDQPDDEPENRRYWVLEPSRFGTVPG